MLRRKGRCPFGILTISISLTMGRTERSDRLLTAGKVHQVRREKRCNLQMENRPLQRALPIAGCIAPLQEGLGATTAL